MNLLNFDRDIKIMKIIIQTAKSLKHQDRCRFLKYLCGETIKNVIKIHICYSFIYNHRISA